MKKNKQQSIKITFLGGLGEIGKNMCAIEDEDEIVIIDCGIMFPEIGMLGIDLVIPDMSYILNNKNKVKGVILTHGHEDHIGAIPYLLKEFNIPVYGTRLTLGLVRARLKEFNLEDQVILVPIEPRTKTKIGNFEFQFIRTIHSIADSVAIAISTPLGTIIHTGDFKIDHSPIDGRKFDFYKFVELGEKGDLLLLSDSTNVEKEGYTESEKELGITIERSVDNSEGLVIFATFASNIHRIQQVFDIATKLKKKVAISGRSMEQTITIAKELGYLNYSLTTLIPLEKVKSYPRNSVLVITTGSQGEPMSALALISNNIHKWIRVKEGDTVIISSSVVPGNERFVSTIINKFFKAGARVVYEGFEDIHVSGHACREELKMMINFVKPKFFIPIHGEARHLIHHADLARNLGIPQENIVVAYDGDVIEVNKKTIEKKTNIEPQMIFVDGKGVGDIGNKVLRDRQALAEDGVVVAVLVVDVKNKILVGEPQVMSRGFVYVKESSDMIESAGKIVIKTTNDYITSLKDEPFVFLALKQKIKTELRAYFKKETDRKPVLLVRILEVNI